MSATASDAVTPHSLQEAAELVAEATANGERVRIGRTLRTDRLTRILEHEAGDLTCTVEAGVRLSQLQAMLARRGQRLALDPPGDPSIGAILARNASGPLRHRFGAPRDQVLGVTLVLADGTIASAGGKVVKNVAGYDHGKLVCGSVGTLALIGIVSLRLQPLPAASGTFVVETSAAGSVVRAIRRSRLQPSALDVLHPGRVAMLFEGSARAVDAQIATARELVGGDEADGSVWRDARERQGEARGRIRFVPGELEGTLARVAEAVVRPMAGVAYVPNPTDTDLPASVRALNRAVKSQFDPTGTFG